MNTVAISPDGQTGWSGSVGSNNLTLWDLATGKQRRSFTGHSGQVVLSVAIFPDGRWGVSAGSDGTLQVWDLATGICLKVLEGHNAKIESLDISPNGWWGLSGGHDIRLWEFDWEYEFPNPSDWDEGARPYLQNFLTLHTPYAGTLPQDRDPTEEEITLALTRRGKPTWIEEDFEQLLYTLGCAGYGWLRPEGVRRELEKMVREWNGLPPLLDAEREKN